MGLIKANFSDDSIKSYKLWIALMVSICLIFSSMFIAIGGRSAPVIVDEDSGGSWTDSFEDESGIEDKNNVTIQNEDVVFSSSSEFNGTNWTKYGLVVDNGGAYDFDNAGFPCILKEGGIYKMWYRGITGSENRILYATSNDGITWNKHGIVLEKGNPGDLDDNYIYQPKVINDGGIYKMWYAGNDGSNDRIFYATSIDGITWVKQGVVLNDLGTRPNTVFKDGAEYKMWYQDMTGGNYKIYYANSTDGINWNPQGLALNIGNPGELDDKHVSGAAVVKESNSSYLMWYNGDDGFMGYRIFYAISNNETNWIRQGLALDWGAPGELDDFGVSYCDVIKDDDGFYKMWYTGSVVAGMTRIFYATCPYPHQFGNLTSVRISLPSGQSWNKLIIDKEEPGTDDYIYVSILDSETNLTISGFENLTANELDIFNLDYTIHPTIRLFAWGGGNGTSTLVLHEWSVTWADTFPPQTPTGLTLNNPFTGYSLILSWNSNSESDLECYVLYFSTDNTTFYWLTNITARTISFIHYGLTQGTTYYYKIAAADEVPNQSNFSYVVEGTPDLDYDGDGIGNIDDPDDDNDGITDISDPYPLNPLNDIEATIDYINETLNDIQSRIIDIQFDLDDLNISLVDLQNTLNFLNQTVPAKIDDIRNKLDNMNLNDSALKIWLEVVLEAIDTNLTTTSDALQNQLDDLDISMTGFYNTLRTDIGDILSALLLHDDTTGENHTDIIILLQDLLNGQIEEEKIDDLKIKLINLAQNLSSHNQSIANDILDVVNDIDTFETETQLKLDAINATLNDLAKLDAIINDLVALNQLLQTMEDDMQDSKSKIEEIDEKIILIELLMIIVLVLLVINIIMTLLKNTQKSIARKQKIDERIEQKKDLENPPPPPPLQDNK